LRCGDIRRYRSTCTLAGRSCLPLISCASVMSPPLSTSITTHPHQHTLRPSRRVGRTGRPAEPNWVCLSFCPHVCPRVFGALGFWVCFGLRASDFGFARRVRPDWLCLARRPRGGRVFRISYLGPLTSDREPPAANGCRHRCSQKGQIGFVFDTTLIFSPKTGQIGFVWRTWGRDHPPPATAIASPQVINHQ
jgi:hypothetical protein